MATLPSSTAAVCGQSPITTIPAAADIAVSVAFSRWREAGGSALQLLLNVGLLTIVGAAALRWQRLIWRRWPS